MGNDLSIEKKRRILIRLINNKVLGETATAASKLLGISKQLMTYFYNNSGIYSVRSTNLTELIWDRLKHKFLYEDEDIINWDKAIQLFEELNAIDLSVDHMTMEERCMLNTEMTLSEAINYYKKEIENIKSKKEGKNITRLKVYIEYKNKIKKYKEFSYENRMKLLRTFVFKDYERRKEYIADMVVIEKLMSMPQSIQLMTYCLYIINYMPSSITEILFEDEIYYCNLKLLNFDSFREIFTEEYLLFFSKVMCFTKDKTVLAGDLYKIYAIIVNSFLIFLENIIERLILGLPYNDKQLLNILPEDIPTSNLPQYLCEVLPNKTCWTNYYAPGSIYIEMDAESLGSFRIRTLQNIKGISFDYRFIGVENPYGRVVGFANIFNISQHCLYYVNYQPEEERLSFEPINEKSLNIPLEWIRVECTDLTDEEYLRINKTIEYKNQRYENSRVEIIYIEKKQRREANKEITVESLDVYLRLIEPTDNGDMKFKETNYKFIVMSGKLMDLKLEDEIYCLYTEGKYNFVIPRLQCLYPEEKMEKLKNEEIPSIT